MHRKLLEAEPYPPSEDTFFLADHIKNEKGESALDIGSGSGYLSSILKESFSLVIGTDILFNVLKKRNYYTENIQNKPRIPKKSKNIIFFPQKEDALFGFRVFSVLILTEVY